MYELSIGDLFRIVFKSLLVTLFIAPLVFLGVYLVHINTNFAYYISDVTNMVSAGFANNIIILSSVFEFGLGCWLIIKLTKTKLFNNIKNFIENL